MTERRTIEAYRDARPREPRCFSWVLSGLALMAAAIAGNLILILGAVR